ncbi:nudix hydrolase 26, chloroplastic isoform X3 [Manihot esculenta]|uniref:nudix hydrolase 26, chloroplastic isoform X3 n=1 Tax=Manihot esculenta TaxID=3983 RepID=UPI000B5D2F2A|nr:nudix hydrolase 26, chloroplastic isoform X3 [Manihot esculenta]
MAVCRSVLYYSPSASLRLVSKSTSPFFINPHKLSRLTKLLFLYQNPRRHSHSAIISRTLCLSSSSSSSSSMESAPEGYRRNVGICLINPSKKIFAASRLDIPNAWQMPQGGIDESEDPKFAAIRELKEETGISSAEVLTEDLQTGKMISNGRLHDGLYMLEGNLSLNSPWALFGRNRDVNQSYSGIDS